MSARHGGGEVACAAALLIATLLKTYPVLLLFAFLIRRDFKVVAWFTIFAAGDALLSWITVPRWSMAWLDRQCNADGSIWHSPYGLFRHRRMWNQSLNGALSRMLGEGTDR